MRHKTNRGVMVIVMMGLVVILGSCSGDHSTPQPAASIAIRAALPVINDVEAMLPYLGTIYSIKEVSIVAQVQGTVSNLPIAEGERVKAGDILVQIEVPELHAVVSRLQTDRDYWCRRSESDKRLADARALPQETAQTSHRACQSAEAGLSEAKSRVNRAVVRSPMNGEVLSWFVEPGQYVMPGQPIMLVGDDKIEIRVDVNEEDIKKNITLKMPVDVEISHGVTMRTHVSEIAPLTQRGSRTFTVTLPMPAKFRPMVRRGYSVKVHFIIASSKNAVLVPVYAIANRATTPSIFMIEQDRVSRREIKLGIEQDGWIEIFIEWNGKDLVAVSNLGILQDNMPVFVVLDEEV